MASKCLKSLQGLALRVTRLDDCGIPITGTSCDFAQTEAFVTINLTSQIEDPDEFLVKLANGKLCINEIGCASLKRYSLEMAVCEGDPDLFNIVSGVNTITDFNGDVAGFEIDQNLGDCNKFALEFWTKLSGDCIDPVTGATQYLYWLLPCITNGRVGDVVIENGALIWALLGDAIPSANWGVGPYNVVAIDSSNTPGPLLSSVNNQVLHVQITTIPPPTGACGCNGGIVQEGYVDNYVDVYA